VNSWQAVVTCVALAACHPAPTGPRLPHGPLASSVAAWIPADVAVVVAIGPDGSAAIDEVTGALGWIGPGVLATIDPAVIEAWAGAAVKPRGAVWMLWDDDARSTATCVVAGNAAKIAAALEAAGGTRQVSAGAILVTLGDTTTVLRAGVACVVDSGAPSRREHYALDLAALTDVDRLLTARPDAATQLRALPAADVIVWGHGELIGGLIEVVPGPATLTLAGTTPAIALAIDPDTHQARITIVAPALGQPPSRADDGALSPSVLALRAPPERRRDLPLPARDENPDVPFSEAYLAAESEVATSLAGAVDLGRRLDNMAEAARLAAERAWGRATWHRDLSDTLEVIEVTWDPPAWPPAALVTAADAGVARARDGEPELRALYDRAVDAVAGKLAARTSIRARDVVAWDRAHRGAVP